MLLEYHRNLLAPLQQTVKTNLINDIPNHSNPFFHWTTHFLKQMTLDWHSNRALNDRLALTALTLGHPNHRSATVLWPWCIAFIARLPEARTQRLKKTSHMCHMLTFHEIWNSATFGTRLVNNPHHPLWCLKPSGCVSWFPTRRCPNTHQALAGGVVVFPQEGLQAAATKILGLVDRSNPPEIPVGQV